MTQLTLSLWAFLMVHICFSVIGSNNTIVFFSHAATRIVLWRERERDRQNNISYQICYVHRGLHYSQSWWRGIICPYDIDQRDHGRAVDMHRVQFEWNHSLFCRARLILIHQSIRIKYTPSTRDDQFHSSLVETRSNYCSCLIRVSKNW